MTDIATLGIKIDASQANAAAGALDKFAASGKSAANSAAAFQAMAAKVSATSSALAVATARQTAFANELERAQKKLADTQERLANSSGKAAERAALAVAKAQDRVTIATERAAAATSKVDVAKAAADLAQNSLKAAKSQEQLGQSVSTVAKQTGLARHEMINLSRQVQDVGVSLVSGQSPFMVLAQQGTQVYDIFASSRGSVRGFGAQLASAITPARALAGGLALVGGAAFAAYSSWKSYAKQLDDTARVAGTTTLEMSKLQAAASSRGIDSKEFSEGMQRFARSVYDAQSGMGGLLSVLRANGIAAKDFNGYIDGAAEVIKRTKSDQQALVLLQQMGLPATMEWVRLLKGGKDGLAQIKSQFTGINEESDKLLAKQREMDKAWNTFWTSAGEKARNAFVIAVSGISGFIAELGKGLNQSAGGAASFNDRFHFPGATKVTVSKDRGGDAVDPQKQLAAIGREQQRLSLLGQTATAEEAALQIQLQANAARLNGIAVDQKRIDILKEQAREQAIGTAQIKSATDAWLVEAATVGMSTGEATRYAAAQNAINEARRAGRVLSDENIASINKEAAALGEAAQRAEMMRWGYENLVRGPLQTFRSEMMNGAKFFDALKKSGLSALDAISQKMFDMIAQDLFRRAMGGSGGGFLSMLGLGGGSGEAINIFGGAGMNHPVPTFGAHSGVGPGDPPTFTRHVPASTFANAPRFHTGVGPHERAAIIRKDESVLTPGQMRALAPVGRSGGGGNQIVNIIQGEGIRSEKRESRQGGDSVTEIVLSVVKQGMADGSLDAPMRSRYGARNRTANR